MMLLVVIMFLRQQLRGSATLANQHPHRFVFSYMGSGVRGAALALCDFFTWCVFCAVVNC